MNDLFLYFLVVMIKNELCSNRVRLLGGEWGDTRGWGHFYDDIKCLEVFLRYSKFSHECLIAIICGGNY